MNKDNSLELLEITGDWPTVAERGNTISLFILKSKKNALHLVENFLKNRKWLVGSSTDIREAFKYITSVHPEYIMVDADHSYSKIKRLPKLLTQSFPVKIIVYTEKDTRVSLKTLASYKVQHILRPPILGTIVERFILKIRYDEAERDRDSLKNEIKIQKSLGPKKSNSEIERALADLSSIMDSANLPDKEKSNWEMSKPKPSVGRAQTGHSQLRGKKESELSIKLGVQVALTETTGKLPKDNADKVENTEMISNVACITIESARFSGYLVCAFRNSKKMDAEFIKTVKKNLFNYLRSKGEVVESEDESMNLEIESVPFEEWAIQQAEFLKRSIYGDNEFAMAFFPTQQVRIDHKDPASKSMLKIKIDDIKADAIVDFDLYFYMAANRRYVLYTPQNMIFYGNQKDRLEKKGVAYMHLRKDCEANIKKYKARVFLNDKIKEWKAKRSKDL